jgi:hypothetical protein
LDIVSRLRVFSPLVMGVQDPAFEKQAMQSAQEQAHRLSQDYPFAAQELSRVKSGTSSSSVQDPAWHPVYEAALKMVQAPSPPTALAPAPDNLSLAQSRQAIEEAVATAGLHSFRMPLGHVGTPEQGWRLAQSVKLANHELAVATQWTGQVLGLGGRVALDLGYPDQLPGSSGVQWRDAKLGVVHVQAHWQTLSHEWFHALDSVASQYALARTSGTHITRQMELLRIPGDARVLGAWKMTLEGLQAASPAWSSPAHAQAMGRAHQTDQYPATMWAEYFDQPTERMAYAFSAFVNRTSPQVLLNVSTDPSRSLHPEGHELDKMSTHWPTLFSSMRHLPLTSIPPLSDHDPATLTHVPTPLSERIKTRKQTVAASTLPPATARRSAMGP